MGRLPLPQRKTAAPVKAPSTMGSTGKITKNENTNRIGRHSPKSATSRAVFCGATGVLQNARGVNGGYPQHTIARSNRSATASNLSQWKPQCARPATYRKSGPVQKLGDNLSAARTEDELSELFISFGRPRPPRRTFHFPFTLSPSSTRRLSLDWRQAGERAKDRDLATRQFRGW